MNKSNTHTPGPWQWTDRYQGSGQRETWSLVGSDGFGILSCDGLGNSPQQVNPADARLIAAAPEILEALEDCLEDLECLADANDSDYARPEPDVIAQARAAIAKAKGEV